MMCVMLCEEVVCLMHLKQLEDPRGKSKQAVVCHVAVSYGQVTHPSVLQPAGCLTKPKGGILYKGINIFPQEDSASCSKETRSFWFLRCNSNLPDAESGAL